MSCLGDNFVICLVGLRPIRPLLSRLDMAWEMLLIVYPGNQAGLEKMMSIKQSILAAIRQARDDGRLTGRFMPRTRGYGMAPARSRKNLRRGLPADQRKPK